MTRVSKQNIIKQFNQQIKQEKRDNKNINECISYWSKLIYLESINFTISDWKIVRAGDYFQKRDLLINNPLKQKQFILESIRKYKKK